VKDAIQKEQTFQNLDFMLKVYGSATNGFWTVRSDIDVAIVLENQLDVTPVPSLSISPAIDGVPEEGGCGAEDCRDWEA
jgi:hypothetical protein